MRIKKILMENFKGVKTLAMNFNERNAEIRATNGAGKTSIFDAYVWLLFDKDSSDKKDFEIKTIVNGQVQHNLEHSVTAVLVAGEKEVVLKKMLKEKWTRKRGSESEEFTGHETSYWVDELPVKKKEYDEIISNLIPENIFKLLSNPIHFNENVDWKEKRKMLFEAFVKEDIDLFLIDSSLEEIRAEIEKHGAEDFKKITAERRKNLNKEIEAIPIRIDETSKSKPDLTGYDEAVKNKAEKLKAKEEIETSIKKLEEDKKNIDNTLLKIRNKNAELETCKINIMNKNMKKYKDAEQKINSLKYDIESENKNIINYEEKIKKEDEKLLNFLEKQNKLRNDWKNAKETQLDLSNLDCTCPTCKQTLPETDKENKTAEFTKNFEENKAKKIKSINDEGIALTQEIKDCGELINKLTDKIVEIKAILEVKNKELEENKLIVKESEKIEINYDDDFEYTRIKAELAAMKEVSFDDADLLEYKNRLEFINDEIKSFDDIISLKKQSEEKDKRIEELQAEQKRLSIELVATEKKDYLIDKYIRLKSEKVEESINNNFSIVNFKLFEEQINGGIKEVCIATVNGVNYSDLNTALKIQAGIDIIKSFSKVYEINVPLFIDGAESIIDIPATESQQIKLIVDDRKEIEGFEKVGNLLYKLI